MNIRTTAPTRRRQWLRRSALAVAAMLAAAVVWADRIELEIVNNAKLSLAQAIEQVERETNGTVVEAELDDDDDMFFYELGVVTEKGLERVYMNPASGAVVGRRAPGMATGQVQKKGDAVRNAGIGLIEAIRIAEERTGGKAVEIDLDRELGGYVYEVKTIQPGREHEVQINAQNGEVLAVEEDD
ncbi:MAG TPA: PepSY domain-containing protein [Pseudomonadales bacterium]